VSGGAEGVGYAQAKGYRVVDLFTMPRGNGVDEEEIDYLRAKLQGIEEGTIVAEPEDRQRVELAMKSYGMLGQTKRTQNLNLSIDAKDLAQVLGWNQSRHTLAQNSTVQSAQRVVDGTLVKGDA